MHYHSTSRCALHTISLSRAETMKKINIRKFNADDLQDVLDLLAKHMSVADRRKSAFRRRFLLSYIYGTPFSLLGEDTLMGSVAENTNGYIIGAIFARRFPFKKSWIIGPVVAHRSFRGSGIALSLMDFVINHLRRKKAKRAILSVETRNIQARRFFEKCGFKYLGSAFTDHELARKYVQKLTLIPDYLQNTSCDTEEHPLQNRITHIGHKEGKNRTWQIMLREL